MELEAVPSSLSSSSSNHNTITPNNSQVTLQPTETYEIEQILEQEPQFHILTILFLFVLTVAVIILVFALSCLISDLENYASTLYQIDRLLKA